MPPLREGHNRRSIRLKGYDYSQDGAYFVTICTHDETCLFDDPDLRRIVAECWLAIPDHFPFIELDCWVIMPNHLHGILTIRRGTARRAPTS